MREVLDSGALRQVVTGNCAPGPGLGGCVFVRGDSNPESMLLSEDELLRDLVRERSIEALYVHGLCVMGTVCVCVRERERVCVCASIKHITFLNTECLCTINFSYDKVCVLVFTGERLKIEHPHDILSTPIFAELIRNQLNPDACQISY